MKLTTPLDKGTLFLDSLTGQEEISGLYSFELAVKSPRRKPVAFESLMGKDIRVDIELPTASFSNALVDGTLPSLQTRRFCGIVQEMTDVGADTDYCHYRLVMRPRFWLWTQKTDCRIFQEQKAGDIIATLLDGLNVDFRLHDDYTSRPYCVQYNESTYDFVTRLMAAEGMFYFFEHQYEGQDDQHRQRGEKLVVTDAVVNLPQVKSADMTDESGVTQLKFDEVRGGNRSELSIYKWHRSQQIVPTKCTLRDHSFQLPGQSLEANEELPQQVQVGEHVHDLVPIEHELEIYEYPGNYAKQFDGIAPGGSERPDAMKSVFQHNAKFAQREIERHATHSVRIQGESDCPQLLPGHKFSLLKDRTVSGPFLVKSVQHDARLNADFRAGQQTDSHEPKRLDEEHTYSNQFLCQPEVQPFQSPRKPPPTIPGFQTATVVGPEGEEIFSDKFGRIKVQFHWDRKGKNNADSSCWIRVSQVWAGNRWGAFFWPRVGHEVVVAFEDGDPDRPLIVGSVYNAKNMPPLPLPDRLTSSGIKSCTEGGNPMENFSCVIFHDSQSSEYLQLHSETHECLTSETAKLNYSNGLKADFQGGQEHILDLFGSGSGSGGGPSDSATPEEFPEALRQHLGESTVDDLESILETFGCAGSGSGGLLSAWLGSVGVPKRGNRAAEAAEEAGVGNEIGSFEMVTGGSGLTRLGSDSENIFGRDIKIACDVESVIDSVMNPLTWILGSPLTNGGYFHQVYGQKQDIVYGRELKVHRGEALKTHQPDLFTGVAGVVGKPTYGQAIAKATAVAVFAMAILLLLFSIAVAIVIKVLMEKPPETQDPEEGSTEEEKKTIEESNQRKLDHWKKIIGRWQFWTKECQSILCNLECFLERLFYRVMKLENDVEKTEAHIAAMAWYITRIYPWSSCEAPSEQKIKLAAKDTEETSEEIKCLFLVIGLFVVAPAVIIPPAMSK